MKKTLFPMAALLFAACSPDPVDFEASVTPYLDDKACAISFTYDDGMLCQYTDVAPELEKRGFRGTFWIIGQNMGRVDPEYPWMTWDQVADLSHRGHEMANHTWSHPSLPSLSPEEVAEEVSRCDSMLEVVTGRRTLSLAYPYNAMSPEVVQICEQGRVGTRTFQVGHGEANSFITPDSLTHWLDELIETGDWGVTMTHGTTYGWDMWNHPEWLWHFYDQVKAAEDRVWVGTFAEVCAYQKEREAATLSVEGDSQHLELKVEVPLDDQLFFQPLTICLRGFDWSGKNPSAMQGEASITVVNRGSSLLLTVNPHGEPVVVKW